MTCRLRPLHRLWFAKLPSWRQAFLLLIGTAFLLQSYVTQTHIHPLGRAPVRVIALASPESDASPKVGKQDQRNPSGDRLPANDDPAKCPLCQAMGQAGQYVWPHAAVFILPQLSAAIVPVV